MLKNGFVFKNDFIFQNDYFTGVIISVFLFLAITSPAHAEADQKLTSAIAELAVKLEADPQRIKRARKGDFTWRSVIPYPITLEVLSTPSLYSNKLNSDQLGRIEPIVKSQDPLRVSLAMWLMLYHDKPGVVEAKFTEYSMDFYASFFSKEYAFTELSMGNPVTGVHEYLPLAIWGEFQFDDDAAFTKFNHHISSLFKDSRKKRLFHLQFDRKYDVMAIWSKFHFYERMVDVRSRDYVKRIDFQPTGFNILNGLIYDGYFGYKKRKLAEMPNVDSFPASISKYPTDTSIDKLWPASMKRAANDQGYRRLLVSHLHRSRYLLLDRTKAHVDQKMLLSWVKDQGEEEEGLHDLFMLSSLIHTLWHNNAETMKTLSKLLKEKSFVIHYKVTGLTPAFSILMNNCSNHPELLAYLQGEYGTELQRWIHSVLAGEPTDLNLKLWSQILDSKSALILTRIILANKDKFKPYKDIMADPRVWAGRFDYNLMAPKQYKKDAINSLLVLQKMIRKDW